MAGSETKSTDTDADSSSSSFQISKYGRRFPNRALDWTLEHLSEFRVVYDDNATDLGKFMTDLKMLKSIARSGLSEMPKISYTLLQYTKDLWNFSYVFYKETGEEMWEARDRIEKATGALEEKENAMEEQIKSNGGNWKRPGECFIEHMVIKDVVVRGIPAVRFNTFQDKYLKVFIVTEVKLYDAFRENYTAETFTFRNVDKRILGQHGIKLLMERKNSFFFPYVVGILCIGTQVILTYLHIDEDHFHQIVEKGEVKKTCKATISYTRPYDFMDASDRGEILETFFWLGFVQSNAYQFKWK